jgi:DNA-binding NarL/FixJ family response regulator
MKILLATEDPDLRLSLELVLSEEPAVTVVGTASESEGLLALIVSTQPSIVLLDWNLPGQPTAVVMARASAICQKARFIVFGSSPAAKQQALAAGAHAFVIKGGPPDQLLTTFRTVRRDLQSKIPTTYDRNDESGLTAKS